MVLLNYHGYKTWSLNNNYTASAVDNFYAVLYHGGTVIIHEDAEVIKLERKVGHS